MHLDGKIDLQYTTLISVSNSLRYTRMSSVRLTGSKLIWKKDGDLSMDMGLVNPFMQARAHPLRLAGLKEGVHDICKAARVGMQRGICSSDMPLRCESNDRDWAEDSH